jgi:4'-phosphopantetheinyl transferase EntD
MSNPVRWLDRLFLADPRVVGEEARLGTEVPEISPAEAADIARAVIGRRVAFGTGRACARRALARLEVTGFDLRNGLDRAPRWPAGIVGSITHTGPAPGGYCAVVVGRSAELAALGVDAEQWGRLTPGLWSRVLTPGERAWVERHDGDERLICAAVIFSAKESFYKAQYPSSGRFLNFQDVEVTVEPSDSTFEVRVLESPAGHSGLSSCSGRFLRVEEFVLTGVLIPASSAAVTGDSVQPDPRALTLPPNLADASALTHAGQFDQEA